MKFLVGKARVVVDLALEMSVDHLKYGPSICSELHCRMPLFLSEVRSARRLLYQPQLKKITRGIVS